MSGGATGHVSAGGYILVVETCRPLCVLFWMLSSWHHAELGVDERPEAFHSPAPCLSSLSWFSLSLTQKLEQTMAALGKNHLLFVS